MKSGIVFEAKTKKYHLRYRDSLIWAARKNRKNETEAEEKLWNEVLRRKQTGYKFVRQKPIDRFVVDFYCSELSLVIEVDGSSHNKKLERDKSRDNFLKVCGIKTIRFTNEEILSEIEKVKSNLINKLKSCPVKGRI
jgi:very-short-patch-repair endonuclease